MRIVDAAKDLKDSWQSRLYRSVLRYKNRWLRDEQLQTGHMYQVSITGEHVTIQTIGPQVSMLRHDADARKEWSVDKETAQRALDFDIIEHDRHRCERCPNPRR